MKRRLIALWILAALLLSGCGRAPESALSESTPPASTLPENTLPASTLPARFSLVEAGYATPVKSQVQGTCWVYAAATSMESAYKKAHGEDIEIMPLDILDRVYGPDKDEGYFLEHPRDAMNIGGWAWQVTETLSNGFGPWVLEESIDYSVVDAGTMKAAIYEFGAMNVAVNDSKQSLFLRTDGIMTLNDPDSSVFDHEVTLVGWDDDFPRERFKKQPAQNGAWLAQNTRGTTWGSGGYYWISYDTPFREQTIFHLTDRYSQVLAYDGGCEETIETGDVTAVANVFHTAGTLKGVGLYSTAPEQEISVEIYDAASSLLGSCRVTFGIQGYHTVALETPIAVSDYSIVLRYSGAAPVEGESWTESGIRYEVTSRPRQSYVLIDGVWRDLAKEETARLLGIDFRPNNACIKALY